MSSDGRKKSFFRSRWFLAAGVVCLLLVVTGYARAYFQDAQIRQQIDSLHRQAGELESKKLELLDLLKYVKSDSYVETKAHTELNMMQSGEHAVAVAMPAAQEANRVRQNDSPVVGFNGVSNIRKWWDYFTEDR